MFIISQPIFASLEELLAAVEDGRFHTIRFNEAVDAKTTAPPFGLLRVAVSDSEPLTLVLSDNTGVERYRLSLAPEKTMLEFYGGRALNTLHNEGNTKLMWTINPLW